MVQEIFELSRKALQAIKDAQSKGLIHRTPLIKSETLSNIADSNVYLKVEALQKTGSFKVRGAYYAVLNYVNEGFRHFITASAGNHAQGVAYSARLFDAKATIVMPRYTPWIKVSNTRKYGAEVILEGESYYEAEQYANMLASKLNAKMIHAYNDPYVIAGQGTIGWEVVEDLSSIDYIIVPVGGGGLISGIAAVLKTVNPRVKVIGVQSDATPSAYMSLREGRIITVEGGDTIADGIAVKRIGDLTFKLMEELVDDIVLVSDQDIVNAILIIAESSKVIAEGAGAASVAALISGRVKVSGNVVTVISGGNIDMNMFAKVIYKGLVQNGRLIMFKGLIPDRPGTLSRVTGILGSLGLNIVDIRHDRFNPVVKPSQTEVEIIVELPPEEDALNKALKALKDNGFSFEVTAP